MALAHLPSNGDMLVLMMMWRNLITHAKQCTEGRMERFDWSRRTSHLQKQKTGDLWLLLAPIIIWSIWIVRCIKVFSANKRPPIESIKLIWHTLITTLRAQYERIDGTDDVSELTRLNFRKRWYITPMAAEIGVDIRWQNVVPRRLFPPPIR